MTITVSRARAWDFIAIYHAAATLRDWANSVESLSVEFATATDLSAAWHGRAGAAASADAQVVGDNIERLAGMLGDAAAGLSKNGGALHDAIDRLTSACVAMSQLGFELNDDGSFSHPPFQPSLGASPGQIATEWSQFELRLLDAQMVAARARDALRDAVAAEGRVSTTLSGVLSAPRPVMAGWVLAQARHLIGGKADPAVADALKQLGALSPSSHNDAPNLDELARTIEAMDSDQLEEFFAEADPQQLTLFSQLAAQRIHVAFFPSGMDATSQRLLVNKLLSIPDPDTVKTVTADMAALIEPYPYLKAWAKSSHALVWGSITAPLFHSGGDPVSVTDIRQGADGDCWFLASLGAVAFQHPDLITENMKANPNGTYTVTFYPHGKPVDVTVSGDLPVRQTTLANGDIVSTPVFAQEGLGGRPASWVPIYEKAYAKLRFDYQGLDGNVPSLALNNIVGPTMHVTSSGVGNIDPGTIATHLAQGQTIVIATKDVKGSIFVDPTAGVVRDHVYMVVGADPAGGTLTLRNPWGGSPNPNWKLGDSGAPVIVHLTPAQIASDFSSIYYGTVKS